VAVWEYHQIVVFSQEGMLRMRFALNVPNFGAFADVRAMAQLAHEAEEAGWDGFFIWDHIGGWPVPTVDPWVTLSAMAMTTSRIRLGPMVTPLPRRRPSKLARETASLDQVSNGRLVLGVGIGDDAMGREYRAYGEPNDQRAHGAMLDEALDVLTGLWRGEQFSYHGKHYTVDDVRFLPTPVQQPRIPIWAAAIWPHKRPVRRSARWDGLAPIGSNMQALTPDDVRAMLDLVHETRPTDDPFDVVLVGFVGELPEREAQDKLVSLAEAGVTWWQEGVSPDDTLDFLHARIQQGPPTL
jgi:alkanesulfonate monooxygenase SsuD/methylene tetrahydromethanopterin reductase-like flavin-dependent oxidoreductase (luciferase family)